MSRQRSAASLGLAAIDTIAVATTQVVSVPISVHGVVAMTAVVNVTETDATPATGTIKIRVRVLNIEDGTTLYEVDLATGMDTSNDAVIHAVTFGPAQTTIVEGGGSAAATANILGVLGKIQLITEIEVATGGSGPNTVDVLLTFDDR